MRLGTGGGAGGGAPRGSCGLPTIPAMRLTEEQRCLIKQLTRELVGNEARVLLFGSRTDDARRGGDIDLLVESPRPLPARFEQELQLGARLERALGGQRVDLLLVDPLTPLQPVHRAAQATGVPL